MRYIHHVCDDLSRYSSAHLNKMLCALEICVPEAKEKVHLLHWAGIA